MENAQINFPPKKPRKVTQYTIDNIISAASLFMAEGNISFRQMESPELRNLLKIVNGI